MHLSVHKRAVGAAAAAVGAAALLAGPAGSLALDAGQTATSLATGSGSAPAASQPTTSTGAPTNVRTAKAVRSRPTYSRAGTQRQAAPAPVSATVQGSNPHGQGTVLAVSLAGKEAIVVGRSRGEQRPDGSYHGHTTTLGLFGNDVIGNDTGPGQTAKGPVAPLQEQLLDQICKGSSGNLCVDVLRADSATTGTGSANHTRILGLMLGGESGLKAMVADSNGNIQSSGDCQQAHGDVTLVQLMLGGNPLLDVGESASDSNSCPSGTTASNSSKPLVAVGGQPIPLPGCGANEPGYLVDLGPLVTIACNAGAATGAGAVVNDALAGTVLGGASGPAATLSGAGTGAAAQAAPSQGVAGERRAGTSRPARGKNKKRSSTPDNGNGSGTDETGAGGNATRAPASAQAPRRLKAGNLPYTGTDVVLALFVASCLLAGGLGLRRLTARTHAD